MIDGVVRLFMIGKTIKTKGKNAFEYLNFPQGFLADIFYEDPVNQKFPGAGGRGELADEGDRGRKKKTVRGSS